MRMMLIVLLMKTFKRELKPRESNAIIHNLIPRLPDYVALSYYDKREVYDDDDDEDMEMAHELGINRPVDPFRILN